jgi:alkanesulfonate monooxygenase SsuD/methylene tetrahydromethanopterin reductase-like flavin-dependent oxidoreductase (luciferase family)
MRFGVGLFCLQSTATAPRHHVRAYREFVEDSVLIESLGYEGVWLSEHHFFYDGYCPAPLPAAAAVLGATTRLRVGTGMLLAPLQRPERLAAAACDLDRRSAGRLDLGLGLGYRDIEFDGKGVGRPSRVRRHREALNAVLAQPDPPRLWVGSATPAGVARAGAEGLGIYLSAANPVSLVRDLAQAHLAGWQSAGSPGGTPPPVAALRNVWITEDPAEREAVLDWVRASYVLYAGLGWSVSAQGDTPAMDFRTQSAEAVRDAVATTIIGSAAQVTEELAALAGTGVEYVVARMLVEGIPRPALHEFLHRMAEHVLPTLAGVLPTAAGTEAWR